MYADILARIGPRNEPAECYGGPVDPFSYHGQHRDDFNVVTSTQSWQDAIDKAFNNNEPLGMRRLSELHAATMRANKDKHGNRELTDEQAVHHVGLEVHSMRNTVVDKITELQHRAAVLLPLYTYHEPGLRQVVQDMNDVFDHAQPENFTSEDAGRLRAIMERENIGAHGAPGVCSRLLCAFSGRIFTAMEANVAGPNFADRESIRPVLASCVGAFGLDKRDEASNFMNFIDAGLDTARFERSAQET